MTNKCTVSGSLRPVMHFCFHFIRGKGDTFNMKWISIMVLWFQIKIRSLFKWYFLICVLCYRSFFVKSYFFICRFCYSFVCVSVFILQVILHLWYKEVICKKKIQKEQYTSCSLRKNILGNVSLHMRIFFSLTKDYVLANTCVTTPAHYIHEQSSLIISDQNY